MKNMLLKVFLILTFFSFTSAYANDPPATETGGGAAGGGMGWGAAGGMMASQFLDGAIGNVVAGVSFATQCGTANKMACVMAAGSFAQAVLDKQGQDGSKDVQRAASNNFQGFGAGEPWGGTDPSYFLDNPEQLYTYPDQIIPAAEAALKKLGEQGYSVDTESGKFGLPDGSTVAGGSAAAMGESGLFTEEEIQNAEKLAAQISSKFNAVKMKVSNRGGASSRSKGSSYSYQAPDYSKLFNRKTASIRDPKTKGLKRLVGGEAIGVPIDNLFEMVRRKYKEKRDLNNFVAR